MAPPKKRGTTKKGTTRLLDLPPVGKVPDPSAGRWDAKNVKLSDDLQRKKNRERARKAALTKRKKAQDLKKSLGQVYKDVEEMMEAPVKKSRPLAGAALKAREDKIKREALKAAQEEEARLQREITEQAEREIQEQLDQQKMERDRYLKLRDAKREARAKITKTLTDMRRRKAGIAQQGAAQVEQQVDADQDDDLDEVEQEIAAPPQRPRSAVGSVRNFFRGVKHAYDNPRWVRKGDKPNQSPTGLPKKGFYYDEYGDLWHDGRKVTGKERTTKSKAATDYASAKQDALSKPTGNPTARAEDVAKWKAATGTDVMSIRTQTGRKAMFQVNMVDRQGKPMDVVFEREVTELEKLSGLQKAQEKWEKDEQRKKDAKAHKNEVDHFRMQDLKTPQIVKTVAGAFLKPAKDIMGELGNVVKGVLGVAGIFAALYGLKKVADNAVPIINGIVDSVLAVEEGFYRMTFQPDKADAIKRQREQNRNSMSPEDQKTADTTGTVATVAGVAGAAYVGTKVAKVAGAAARLGRGLMGIGGEAAGAGAAETAGGAALGAGSLATAGLATLGVAGYLGVYRPTFGKEGQDAAEVYKMAASGDPKAAVLYAAANIGKNASDADIIRNAAGTMTQGTEGIPNAGRDYTQNLALANDALKALKQQGNGSIPSGNAAIDAAKNGFTQLPMGIRNNNPGNLRKDKDSFRVYDTPLEGLQAESTQLGLYFNGQSKAAGMQRLTSVSDVINKWAPAGENNTKAYIKNVSKALNVNPTDKIDLNDPEVRIKFMQAINTQENGKDPYDASLYRQAVPGTMGIGKDVFNQGEIARGAVPVQKMEDPNLLRQQIAAQQAANNAPPAGMPTAQAMPLPSNWQQRPGLHSDYIDNVPMLVMNGGALAS